MFEVWYQAQMTEALDLKNLTDYTFPECLNTKDDGQDFAEGAILTVRWYFARRHRSLSASIILFRARPSLLTSLHIERSFSSRF